MISRMGKALGTSTIQAILLGTLCAAAHAAAIDVGTLNYVTLSRGSEITIEFGVANYARNNPGYSAYPSSLSFEAAGPALASVLDALPGSSAAYFAGYELDGWLESLDGSTALALADANAARLGMDPGTLLVTPGSMSNGVPVALIGGSRKLTPAESQALFGADGEAIVRIRNMGANLTLGLGPGYTVRNSIWEPDVAGAGPVQTAGVTRGVALTAADATTVPEPGAWLLMASGLLALVLYTGAGCPAIRTCKARRCTNTSSR